MSFENEFLELMPHTIQVFSYTGEDFEGVDQFETDPKYYRCRISGKGIALRRQMSSDDTVIYDIWLDPRPRGADGLIVEPIVLAEFKTEDKVVLPVDVAWTDQTPVLFAVSRLTDDEGHHHVKLQCGWMYHRQGQ